MVLWGLTSKPISPIDLQIDSPKMHECRPGILMKHFKNR